MGKTPLYKVLIVVGETDYPGYFRTDTSGDSAPAYDIQSATSVPDAWVILERWRPDCIMVAAEVAGFSGIDWLKELKSHKTYRHYPVIMFTSSGHAGQVLQFIREGASDVLLTNEIDAPAVHEIIRRVVRKSRFCQEVKEYRKVLWGKNKELSEYKKYLEMRVAERSAELKQSYEQLIEEMTARKRIEAELTARNKELDTFVYKASHDLKGPLASLTGITNVAKLEITDPQAAKYLDMIGDNCHKLNATLTNLLEVTKIKYADVEAGRIDFDRLIEDITDRFAGACEMQGVVLTSVVNQQAEFYSDSYLIFTLLHNLVDNAILYRNPKASPSFVSIEVSDVAEGVKVVVTDNGQGIEKDVQPKVFDMFFRYNLQSKGSGLGLYVLKNCVDKLSGRVELISEPGVGTDITVVLPSLPVK
jgi:signal transduction histidine kinase